MRLTLLVILLLLVCSLHETLLLSSNSYSPNFYSTSRSCSTIMSLSLPDEKQREAITASSNPSIMVVIDTTLFDLMRLSCPSPHFILCIVLFVVS